ncbi:histone deacetylase family protein [Cupriavidus plantarum]|uniref:Acetoin utilization deacetylase AcuC-like enzyme n=1 Tax=Cupriavidus plantarum TaxID=942865 RepID=A0A316EW60_9BURK|nr:histone deacetylase family protein [Cupriavidus plantarum]NYH99379.1 acetoin utilization deacetylase AcuC-like enzyme [Cupriavidus plantarum]PWK36591.1 acetoin utilization deacetylase AcuC-like enzyme [Cupriavidus plantarum]REF02671.1 acetoin utilization deacetylase AcuC-like enzyme [Cupriavidus plantarum]RLK44465.1 acetoin utilization deacetylase AcuC-like enzyme [Cupriavidus plantarum]
MPTGYYTHPAFLLHEMGHFHPECPERLQAIEDHLISHAIDGLLDRREAPAATAEQIERVHRPDYVSGLASLSPAAGYQQIDPDTSMNAHTLTAATHAAGAAVAATDAVIAGELENAFCCVRPPGHHAEPGRAMGFCFYNNVAIAARHALAAHGLERVAVIDFDVHHGNGTEAAFRNEPRVLMCSFFQHPFYPYSGTDHVAPNMSNIPLPAYSNGLAVREVVDTIWLPRLHDFKPEMIFISAGFDAHREDDLGQMGLVEQDYAWMTAQLIAVARTYARGRIVSCLEGGYNLSALGRSVLAHLKVLLET